MCSFLLRDFQSNVIVHGLCPYIGQHNCSMNLEQNQWAVFSFDSVLQVSQELWTFTDTLSRNVIKARRGSWESGLEGREEILFVRQVVCTGVVSVVFSYKSEVLPFFLLCGLS